jgi:hypothetical protein
VLLIAAGRTLFVTDDREAHYADDDVQDLRELSRQTRARQAHSGRPCPPSLLRRSEGARGAERRRWWGTQTTAITTTLRGHGPVWR